MKKNNLKHLSVISLTALGALLFFNGKELTSDFERISIDKPMAIGGPMRLFADTFRPAVNNHIDVLSFNGVNSALYQNKNGDGSVWEKVDKGPVTGQESAFSVARALPNLYPDILGYVPGPYGSIDYSENDGKGNFEQFRLDPNVSGADIIQSGSAFIASTNEQQPIVLNGISQAPPIYPGGLFVYRNEDGFFKRYGPFAPSTATAFATGKVIPSTGHSLEDIVYVDPSSKATFTILQNTGPLTFKKIDVITGSVGASQCLLADVNGDKRLDVITSYPKQGIIFWFENPNSAGEKWIQHIVTVSVPIKKLAVADIEGAGVTSLVGIGEGVFWFRNVDGKGTSWEVRTLPKGRDPHDLQVADATGDGKDDVFVFGLPGASDSTFEIEFYKNTTSVQIEK